MVVSAPLQFHVEAGTRRVWAKSHDKETSVIVSLDPSVVADFDRCVSIWLPLASRKTCSPHRASSHQQPITAYRGGLFEIRQASLSFSTEYPDVFRSAQGTSTRPDKLFLHVKELRYLSAKGEPSFAGSCKDLTDCFAKWAKEMKARRKRRDAWKTETVDTAGTQTQSGLDLPPPMLDDPVLSQLVSMYAMEDRQPKPAPPGGAEVFGPAAHIVSEQKSVFLPEPGSAADPEGMGEAAPALAPAPALYLSSAELGPLTPLDETRFTFDESLAMSSTPSPPPTSTATSAAQSPAASEAPAHADKELGTAEYAALLADQDITDIAPRSDEGAHASTPAGRDAAGGLVEPAMLDAAALELPVTAISPPKYDDAEAAVAQGSDAAGPTPAVFLPGITAVSAPIAQVASSLRRSENVAASPFVPAVDTVSISTDSLSSAPTRALPRSPKAAPLPRPLRSPKLTATIRSDSKIGQQPAVQVAVDIRPLTPSSRQRLDAMSAIAAFPARSTARMHCGPPHTAATAMRNDDSVFPLQRIVAGDLAYNTAADQPSTSHLDSTRRPGKSAVRPIERDAPAAVAESSFGLNGTIGGRASRELLSVRGWDGDLAALARRLLFEADFSDTDMDDDFQMLKQESLPLSAMQLGPRAKSAELPGGAPASKGSLLFETSYTQRELDELMRMSYPASNLRASAHPSASAASLFGVQPRAQSRSHLTPLGSAVPPSSRLLEVWPSTSQSFSESIVAATYESLLPLPPSPEQHPIRRPKPHSEETVLSAKLESAPAPQVAMKRERAGPDASGQHADSEQTEADRMAIKRVKNEQRELLRAVAKEIASRLMRHMPGMNAEEGRGLW